jgi:hypothetical protein
MASSMKASAPAANKCRNFSSGNKVTLPVAQVQVVDAQVKVAPDRAGLVPVVDAQVEVKAVEDKADLVPVVDAQVKVAPVKAGLMPAVVAQVKVAPVKVALDHLIP